MFEDSFVALPGAVSAGFSGPDALDLLLLAGVLRAGLGLVRGERWSVPAVFLPFPAVPEDGFDGAGELRGRVRVRVVDVEGVLTPGGQGCSWASQGCSVGVATSS